jgi:sulfate adenylyltransferase subunit 1 (EFTu-like GTPase family)
MNYLNFWQWSWRIPFIFASVSIILIDARNGVGEQTRRHFYISSLLEIKNVVVAVNKMDLVEFNEGAFNQISAQFESFASKYTGKKHTHNKYN